MLLNTTVLVTNGFSTYENGTEVVVCYAWYDYDYTLFDLMGRVIKKIILINWYLIKLFKLKIHLYTYSIIPFCLLAIINCMLVYTTLFHGKVKSASAADSKNKSKKVHMTVTVFIITIAFILLTLPGNLSQRCLFFYFYF